MSSDFPFTLDACKTLIQQMTNIIETKSKENKELLTQLEVLKAQTNDAPIETVRIGYHEGVSIIEKKVENSEEKHENVPKDEEIKFVPAINEWIDISNNTEIISKYLSKMEKLYYLDEDSMLNLCNPFGLTNGKISSYKLEDNSSYLLYKILEICNVEDLPKYHKDVLAPIFKEYLADCKDKYQFYYDGKHILLNCTQDMYLKYIIPFHCYINMGRSHYIDVLNEFIQSHFTISLKCNQNAYLMSVNTVGDLCSYVRVNLYDKILNKIRQNIYLYLHIRENDKDHSWYRVEDDIENLTKLLKFESVECKILDMVATYKIICKIA